MIIYIKKLKKSENKFTKYKKDMILHYLKIAWRNLLKYRMQNVISILGLAVGLFSFCVCMYCSRFMLSTNHCFENYERIVQVSMHNSRGYFSGTPATLCEDMRSWMKDVVALSFVTFPRQYPFDIEVKPGKILPYELVRMEVDSLYARIFTPHILTGSWTTAAHTPNALVMSRQTAIRIFGSEADAIGKVCTLTRKLHTSPSSTSAGGGIQCTVQAVMDDTPLNNSLYFMETVDMLVLNDSEGLLQSDKRHDMTRGNTFALLSSESDISRMEENIRQRDYTWKMYGEDYDIEIFPIGQFPDERKQLSIVSWITGAMGVLILLVGLINFFHFLTGSYLNRMKEFSMMKVNGCSGKQLFALLFTQSLMAVLAASLLMLCGIEITDGWMDLDCSILFLEIAFDKTLLMKHAAQYILLLTLLCAVICSAVTLIIRHISVQAGLNGGQWRQGKHWGRNLMLGIQFFVCWIFVSLSGALYLQSEKTSGNLLHTLSSKEKASILSIPLDYSFMSNSDKESLVNRLKSHAAIEDVLLSDVDYLRGTSGNIMLTEKGNADAWVEVNVMAVPKNFFSFMNIPLEQGHGLQTSADIVADRTWQQRMGKDVIGMPLYGLQNHGYTVCGICAPFQTSTYTKGQGYVFILYDASDYIGHCYLKCRNGSEKEVRAWSEQILRETLPESVPVEINTLLDDIHNRLPLEYTLKNVMLFFAIVSILVTLLGVYSSIMLDTERRQKEVAIRKINGAGVSHIMLLFSRLYIILLSGSALLAFPLVYYLLQQWKQMYVVFFDCGILFWGSIFVLVTAVTALTIIFRILHTARQNPAEVVKKE